MSKPDKSNNAKLQGKSQERGPFLDEQGREYFISDNGVKYRIATREEWAALPDAFGVPGDCG